MQTDDMSLILQELRGINGRLDQMDTRFDKFETRMDALENSVRELKEDVAVLKTDVAELKEDVAELKEEHNITRDGVNALIAWTEDVAVAVKIPFAKPRQEL